MLDLVGVCDPFIYQRMRLNSERIESGKISNIF